MFSRGFWGPVRHPGRNPPVQICTYRVGDTRGGKSSWFSAGQISDSQRIQLWVQTLHLWLLREVVLALHQALLLSLAVCPALHHSQGHSVTVTQQPRRALTHGDKIHASTSGKFSFQAVLALQLLLLDTIRVCWGWHIRPCSLPLGAGGGFGGFQGTVLVAEAAF